MEDHTWRKDWKRLMNLFIHKKLQLSLVMNTTLFWKMRPSAVILYSPPPIMSCRSLVTKTTDYTVYGIFMVRQTEILTWPKNNLGSSHTRCTSVCEKCGVIWDLFQFSPNKQFSWFRCWTLILLSHHRAWLHRGYWRYRSLIDWLIDSPMGI